MFVSRLPTGINKQCLSTCPDIQNTIIVVKNSDSQRIQHNIQDISNIPSISAVMMICLFSNVFC